ncbi:MAG: signal peptidase II [Desulfuromonas sp.]|nr:MAG: signal peptidase II [Desulfuromonas sp.]
MMVRYRLLILVTLLVLLADQWSKWFIDHTMALHQSRTVIENFFNITYVHNQGAAFGILANSDLRLPLLSGVAVLACLVIGWMFRRLPREARWQRFGLALVFSGALGNLIDRVRLGVVIDFLDVHWYQHHWPAFNVADSAITVGVGLLLIDLWLEERQRLVEKRLNATKEGV